MSRAIDATSRDITSPPGTFGAIVRAIEFDEPPWGRFLDEPVGRFQCPACGKVLAMHVHYGPGTPGTERFGEVGLP
jgi:hypothetical protein